MIDRRRLLAMAAAAPAAAAFPQLASAALPNLSGLRTRNIASGAIEVIYKTPHTKPNGLDVTKEIRRWRLSHHRIILDAVVGRSDDGPQEALLTHMRMSYTEPERYSTLAKKTS